MSDTAPRPVAGVSVCVIRDGAVLLVRRAHAPAKGLWSLPGGKVEPGEPVRAAAIRELKEETGVTAKLTRLLDVVDIIHRDRDGIVSAHYILTVFAARRLSGKARPASDAEAAAWVRVADLDRMKLTPGTADLIRRVAADEL